VNQPLVIVGDSMLDIDIEGSANRLSPEAPVPVVDATTAWQRPGGAGLAALLAARTEPDVVLVTGVADDDAGATLSRLLAEAGVTVVGLSLTGSTVTKTRVRARGQSMLRIDTGGATLTSPDVTRAATDIISTARAVCVADYGAGVTAAKGIRKLLQHIATNLPVVWDPHPRGTDPVPGCAVITPNESEVTHFCDAGQHAGSPAELRERWSADAVCVTLGERGADLYDGGPHRHRIAIPELAAAGAVRGDVCGAGDRFAIALAAELAGGAAALDAATVAVASAARFVSAGGAAGVSTPAALQVTAGQHGSDVQGASDIDVLARRLGRTGRSVVATGGCFDLLHTGHIRLLRRARELGDMLGVLINSDESVRQLKGSGRPVVSARDRARVLMALSCVDAVAIFDERTPERALEVLRPDIWVKGGDYRAEELPESTVVRRHGGEVVIVPTVPGYSSSKLIASAVFSQGKVEHVDEF